MRKILFTIMLGIALLTNVDTRYVSAVVDQDAKDLGYTIDTDDYTFKKEEQKFLYVYYGQTQVAQVRLRTAALRNNYHTERVLVIHEMTVNTKDVGPYYATMEFMNLRSDLDDAYQVGDYGGTFYRANDFKLHKLPELQPKSTSYTIGLGLSGSSPTISASQSWSESELELHLEGDLVTQETKLEYDYTCTGTFSRFFVKCDYARDYNVQRGFYEIDTSDQVRQMGQYFFVNEYELEVRVFSFAKLLWPLYKSNGVTRSMSGKIFFKS